MSPKEMPQPQNNNWWIPAAIAGALLLIVLAIGALLILPKLNSVANEVPEQGTPAASTNGSVIGTNALPASEDMLQVVAGNYQVGISPADDFHAAKQTVSLAEFWIAKYPVTNDQYQGYIQQTGAPAPQLWPGDAKHPVRGVNWEQANAYCTWMKERLPTEAEWEAAGRGPANKPPLFPWGDDPIDGGKVLQMPDQDTYEVGSLSFNVNPLGLYDLVGDVWQWVGDPYTNVQQGYKILRGGRYGLPQDLAYRIAVAPDDSRYVKFAGFRCAADTVR